MCISSASERKETCINVQPLLGHPVSENYGELVSNTEEQLRIVFMYTGNLFHLHDLAIWKWLKKMCTFEVHLCMMYGQLILSGKPFNTFSMARLNYCNCVWPSLPFSIPPRTLLYKSLLPRMACIFFLSGLSPFSPMAMICDWNGVICFYSLDPSFMTLVDSPLFVKFSKMANVNFRESDLDFLYFLRFVTRNPLPPLYIYIYIYI